MSRICIIFYACVPTLMPVCHYEQIGFAFKNAGHEVLMVNSRHSIPNKRISEAICNFKPDLILTYNHVIDELIYKITDCPIVVLEADTFSDFSNKELIKKYVYKVFIAIFHKNVVNLIERQIPFIGKDKIIIFMNSTSLKPEVIPMDINISFIGTLYQVPKNGLILNIVDNFNKTPYLHTAKNIFEKALYNFEAIEEADLAFLSCGRPELLNYLSTYTRQGILDAIAPLGLHCYGHFPNLEKLAQFYDLFFCLKNTPVYTMAENQQIYNRSKISINCHFAHNIRQAEYSSYSWRVPDIMATNSCLVSTECHALDQDFGKWVKIPQFSNKVEAYEICEKLLKDDSWRNEIVRNSQIAIEEGGFTFDERVKEFEQLFNLKKQENVNFKYLIDLEIIGDTNIEIVNNISLLKSNVDDIKVIHTVKEDLILENISNPVLIPKPLEKSKFYYILYKIYTLNLETIFYVFFNLIRSIATKIFRLSFKKIFLKLGLHHKLRELMYSYLGK